MRSILCGVALSACATTTMVLKSPVQQRCEQAQLKGCPEVVDGVMLYVQGDEATAREKLRVGAAKNSPDDLRRFAQLLLDVSSLPAASQFAEPVTQVAKLLVATEGAGVSAQAAPGAKSSPASSASAASGPPAAGEHEEALASERTRDRGDYALYALTALVDPTRTETESVLFGLISSSATCPIAGMTGLCVARRAGPLVVTDILAVSGCPGRLFVGSSFSDNAAMGFHWFAEATADGLTGARLFIGGGEWLQVVYVPNPKADPRDPRCAITWSGFRPRIVPAKM